MAQKRNRESAKLNSVSDFPPNKKQKVGTESESTEPLETKNDDAKILLCMDTKLGQFRKEFDAKDLQMIIYFKNQLSERWNTSNNNNNENTVTMSSNELCFGVDEIEVLIYIKKYNTINIKYPCNRLIYLCNALDYFAETMDGNMFEIFFEDCIPAIKYQNLFHLKSLCQSTTTVGLLRAINSVINAISKQNTKINCKVSNRWRSVPIQLLLSNSEIAASVFCKTFITEHTRDGTNILIFTLHRSYEDLFKLWRYIVDNQLYKMFPQILSVVYNFKRIIPSFRDNPTGFEKNTGIVISRIVVDVLCISMGGQTQYTHKENILLIKNVFESMRIRIFEHSIAQLSIGVSQEKAAKSKYLRYDFLFSVFNKLSIWRRSDPEKVQIYFGEDSIVKFYKELQCVMQREAYYRNFIHDIESLKVSQMFSKTEQYALLRLILENYKTLGLKKEESQNIIKTLIENDYNFSFGLTKLWFPIFMKDNKNWIINVLPQKTSSKTLQMLIEGICDYIVSKECKENGCDNEYIEFVNQYTNVQWKVSL